MTDTPPAASLFDVDGSFICDLPLAAGIAWQDELSAPGALSLRLPLDDAATAQVTARRIVKVSWRGGVRQAARVGGSSTDLAVDGRVWREWSMLPGLLDILGGVPVYPEYGLGSTSSAQRTFGYPAREGHGAWLDSGNFTPAVGVAWSAMTGARAGVPEGLDFPDPQWIAKNGPNADEPPNSYQYFRRVFDTTTRMTVQILATGDNYLDLWLDGDKIVESGDQNQFTWRNVFQVSLVLDPSPVGGRHTLAARVRNNKDTAAGPNHMGFLFTMQEVDSAGNVLEQPPIINSDSDWTVSDIAPGFRRAEVLIRQWGEANLYGYGATALLPLGFTGDADSDGVDWSEDPGEYTFDVGSTVLDMLATFTESAVDVGVDPDSLHLDMWNRRGSDLSASVALAVGVNLMEHTPVTETAAFNTILMQLSDGRWVQRQNLAGVAANGREAAALSAGSTSDTKSAYQIADAQLADAGHETVSFTTRVSTVTGPQPYVDFGLGDTITVPDEDGTGAYAVRVMAITPDASADGPVQVTLELMLDRSATPMVLDSGGAGVGDPGDLESGGTPDPITEGGGDVAYDWTASPYGTVYDAMGGAGGYVPDATHSGVPAGSTLTTVTATGGFLSITATPSLKGTGSASASGDTISLTGHGMPNGQPVYFSALSSDGAGLSAGVEGWGVVANATTNTFKVRRCNEATGLFSTVNITADYASVTVMAGVWYDQIDFGCYITLAPSSSGPVLFTRRRGRGPATASATSANAAQGMIFNLSNAWVLDADAETVPDVPVAKLDAYYGRNFRVWRSTWRHVIDGCGSHGNNVFYGCYATDGAWFYPDPQHTDGSHADLGMQVFGGAKHRMVGCHIDGLVDATVATTSDPTHHPVPTWTNTVLQVNHASGLVAPTDVTWSKCLLGGGAFTINIDGKESRPNLGGVEARFKRNAHYGAIAAPSPGAVSGAVIHYNVAGCVYDDDGSTIAPGNGLYVAPGASRVWP